MYSEKSESMQSGQQNSEYSIDCFQNYTASEVFIDGLARIVNQGDVVNMIKAQKQMLQRFEKTNEMLLNCNALSSNRLKTANDDFKKHIKLLNEMRKDLDYVFKKIRNIKAKLNVQLNVDLNNLDKEDSIEDVEKPATDNDKLKKKHLKKITSSNSSIFNYMKMEYSPPENDKSQRTRPAEDCVDISSTDNSNSTSECTSDAG